MRIDLGWLVLVLAALSIVWVLINRFFPMEPTARAIVGIVFAAVACVLVLEAVGLTRISIR